MTPPAIEFYEEAGGRLPVPEEQQLLTDWIRSTIERSGGQLGTLTYVCCGDDYLHAMNVEYLQHDTLTDIITFPYEVFPRIAGDLFISTERVADNAQSLGVPYHDEFHRVAIHGVLHLLGQADKTEEDAVRMREREEEALHLRPAALRQRTP